MSGRLPELIGVSDLQAFGQFAGGTLDGIHAHPQHSRQTEFMLASQTTNKFQNKGVDLQGRTAWHHLQQLTGGHLAQRGLAFINALAGRTASDDVDDLGLIKGREVATQHHQAFDDVPVHIKRVNEAAWTYQFMFRR